MFYAIRVAPELQNDNLFYEYRGKDGRYHCIMEDDYLQDNIIIDGNNKFRSFYPERLENLKNDIYNAMSDYDGYYGHKEKISSVISWYFKKDNKQAWSKKELHAWIEVFNLYDNGQDDDAMLKALKLITGIEWRQVCLRGCCQGDWQDGFASSNLSDKQVDYIEACYFNTGAEFIVYDNYKDYRKNENGCSYYVVDMKDLCEYIDCDKKQLKIYDFDGYTQKARYKLVEAY